MKLNRPLKDTRDKELSNLRFDVLFYTSGVILVPMISEKMYNALIVEGYPGWLIISTLIICDLFFLIKVIVTFVKISQTKKLCDAFQKNINAYSPLRPKQRISGCNHFQVTEDFCIVNHTQMAGGTSKGGP